MPADQAPEGFEVAPADWFIEDRVTSLLREAKPKARSLAMTDDEARALLDRTVFNKEAKNAVS